MPNPVPQNLQDLARQAAIAAAPRDGVGQFIETVAEGEGVTTYLFASKLKGYRDWRWNVVLFQASAEAEATVSEVVLMPGSESLIAPDWVPWSERLADYKALQAELEAQAALEAAEAGELDEDDEDSEDSDDDEVEAESESGDSDEAAGENAPDLDSENSAVANSDQSDDAEDDPDRAGIWPKRLFGRRKGRVKGKDRNKGKNPKN
jgi:hypothetical protein